MTPYAVLLVTPNEADAEIRAAYHKMAEQHHPDKNNGIPGPRWHEATEAYNIVKTEELRGLLLRKQSLLAGLCKDCEGSGVVSSRLGKKKVRVCTKCFGEGRIV